MFLILFIYLKFIFIEVDFIELIIEFKQIQVFK